MYALLSDFCPSGYDFAIPSSRLYLTVQTLGVAIRFVGNYALVDFHHRLAACPPYSKNTRREAGVDLSLIIRMEYEPEPIIRRTTGPVASH